MKLLYSLNSSLMMMSIIEPSEPIPETNNKKDWGVDDHHREQIEGKDQQIAEMNGQKVLVTGAGAGIGRGLTKTLLDLETEVRMALMVMIMTTLWGQR